MFFPRKGKALSRHEKGAKEKPVRMETQKVSRAGNIFRALIKKRSFSLCADSWGAMGERTKAKPSKAFRWIFLFYALSSLFICEKCEILLSEIRSALMPGSLSNGLMVVPKR